ncbi:MAG: RimK family protein [Phycisphaerae bacterium]|nr:RimK family protein [Phycisphaerae bacterium]
MHPLIVVDNPKRWPLNVPGATVVGARAYLTEPAYSEVADARVFNLCRSYRYQSNGYYVSLLAMARGHKPMPSIATIQDLRTVAIVRLALDDLDEIIQRNLRPIESHGFTLSVYFGRNLAKRYDALSWYLFRLFQAPFLRTEFAHDEDGWRLHSIRLIGANDIPDAHREFATEAMVQFFAKNRAPTRLQSKALFDLAILHDPAEKTPPSDPVALKRFAEAAERQRLSVELIQRQDYGRLPEFDALFIRETTAVNHHTYRFARRAAAEGLVVIDDPDSILKCTNKVYLAELLERRSIATPKTLIVHRDNWEDVEARIGLPCVLKEPDSSFSQGVIKVEDKESFDQAVGRLLGSSELIIAQEFLPTEFDWRVTVLDDQLVFACKYFMARRHWQIIKTGSDGAIADGKVEAVAVEQVPPAVLKTALRAAKLIGNGLYGVDLKQVGKHVFVIEINDNPSIEAGYEDRLLKRELYDRIMRVFAERIRRRKSPGGSGDT